MIIEKAMVKSLKEVKSRSITKTVEVVVCGIINVHKVLAEELQSRSAWGREGKVLKFPCSFTAETLTRAKKKTKTGQLI